MIKDSNRKCAVIIFDKTQRHVLLVQEKYTNDRLHEWVQWEEWNADRLVERMNEFGEKEICSMELTWGEEWLEKAGCLTSDDVKNWLLNKREIPEVVLRGLGKWGIPKGHVRYGESFIDGMMREIREEIGVTMRLTYAFHQKKMQRNVYVARIKKTTEFNMGEEIDCVKWVSVSELTEIENNKNYNCTVKLPNYFLSVRSMRQ